VIDFDIDPGIEIELPPTKAERHAQHYAGELRAGTADAYTHLAMGLVWQGIRRYHDALACLERAASSEPYVPWVLCARANLLATCPDDGVRDGRRALADAQRAYADAGLAGELNDEWRLRTYLAVLAAAHAECGDLARAAELLTRGIARMVCHTSKRKLAHHLQTVQRGEPIRCDSGLAGRSIG
jgi:hypothetical protein